MMRLAQRFVPMIAAWAGLSAVVAGAGDGLDVRVDVRMLVCHEQAGGARPPDATGEAAEHDKVFFVVAGRGPGDAAIREVQPKDGSHLKLDTRRGTRFVKGVSVWRGTLKEGEAATVLLSVREQDGADTAERDLAEAADLAAQVDHAKSLKSLARIPVREILDGNKGENDHIGTIVVRVANVGGKLRLETEPGADASPLKGFAADDPRHRAFRLAGDHSQYDIQLEVSAH